MALKPVVDPNSETWLAVKAFADKTMESARSSIDQRGLEPVPTEFERGRIDVIRALLGLPKAV